jgi:hypothetical protein
MLRAKAPRCKDRKENPILSFFLCALCFFAPLRASSYVLDGGGIGSVQVSEINAIL